MADRYKELEALQARVRAGLAAVVPQWLAAARAALEKLTTAALDPDVSDLEFTRMVETAIIEMPSLMDELDHDALAAYMERAMGAAYAQGIAAGYARTPNSLAQAREPSPGA